MLDFFVLLTWNGFILLFTLSLLEIVLGIDNILFISIVTAELPDKQKKQTRNIGLIIALLLRLILLTIVSWLIGLTEPLFYLFSTAFSAQSLVLFLGGIFLIYKSVHELHKSASTEKKIKKEIKNQKTPY